MRSTPWKAVMTCAGGSLPYEGTWVSEIRPIFMPFPHRDTEIERRSSTDKGHPTEWWNALCLVVLQRHELVGIVRAVGPHREVAAVRERTARNARVRRSGDLPCACTTGDLLDAVGVHPRPGAAAAAVAAAGGDGELRL